MEAEQTDAAPRGDRQDRIGWSERASRRLEDENEHHANPPEWERSESEERAATAPPAAALFPNDRSDRVEARRSLPRHLDKDEDVRVPGISSPRVKSIKESPFLRKACIT